MLPAPDPQTVRTAFEAARERYAVAGVDARSALRAALAVPISLHCWQADDITGLEPRDGAVEGGGILATGNYPGRARNGDEVRADLQEALRLLPGVQRVNIHASYAEPGGKRVERDELEPAHFTRWIDWALARGIGLDFNTTFFAHPLANSGATLSHRDAEVRAFWIRHGIACRRIATAIGEKLDSPCVLNHWLPDGAKDSPADRWSPRRRLVASLDAMLAAGEGIDPRWCVDAVESKLFGIGSEDYVVGSAEFYTAYAVARNLVLCMDMGHYHPTETIHDKLSALLAVHRNRILIHTSRPIRWDSDHVVVFNEDVRNVFLEIARGRAFDRVLVALDFFDASINRIAAYVIGARATRKAILQGFLDPVDLLQTAEAEGRLGEKLALMEECRTLPFGAVWDMLCLEAGVPVGGGWIDEVARYEREVLASRR